MKLISTFNQAKAAEDPEYAQALLSHFDKFYLVGPGCNWNTPAEMDAYERGLDWLLASGKEVIGHSLFVPEASFNKNLFLNGILKSSVSQAEREDAVYAYTANILLRFGDRIKDWYFLNECTAKTGTLAHKVYGDSYWSSTLKICRELKPGCNFRINEYGFQNKHVVQRLRDEIQRNPTVDGVGMQVYTSGKNPLLGLKLAQRLAAVRSAVGDELPIYFSEVAIISKKPARIKQAYRAIKRVAEENGIEEFGFWWPTDRYNTSCWDKISSGLWDVEMNSSPSYEIFFR